MRRLAAAVLVCLAVGFVQAEELTVTILKVDGNMVTVRNIKKGTTSPEMTFQVSKDVKIASGKFSKDTKKFEVDGPIADGLKNPMFATGKTRARITINNNRDRITQILTITLKKKGA